MANILLDQVRAVIWEALEAVPNHFIENLVSSWWDTCRAVIDTDKSYKVLNLIEILIAP